MGDRTSVSIYFRERDRKAVNQVFGYEADEYFSPWEGAIGGWWYEMNGGACDEQEELVKMGIVFEGSHGAGSEYLPMVFAHDGFAFVEVCTDMDGTPMCYVVDGEVRGLEEVHKYKKILANVHAIFKAEEEKP